MFFYFLFNFFSQQKFSTDPIEEITNVFKWLELEVSDEIIQLSQSLNKGKNSQIHIPDQSIQHDRKYNKKFSNEYYKLVLTKEEIDLIDAFVAEERFELPTFGL